MFEINFTARKLIFTPMESLRKYRVSVTFSRFITKIGMEYCQVFTERKLIIDDSAEGCLKATSHLTIFDIPMHPVREDQRHRRRFTR